jgi:hypothetical protein
MFRDAKIEPPPVGSRVLIAVPGRSIGHPTRMRFVRVQPTTRIEFYAYPGDIELELALDKLVAENARRRTAQAAG